uniref:Polycystin cation channel PKD1/PKD2 domain-containing protein n=1 Tax=Schizophyllum commune (strain H4-8 / FGSC 9210) TaxID=578458 RepID=D8Q4C4_SCHCM
MDPEDMQSAPLLAPTQDYLASVKVFPLIRHLRKDVLNTIDSALSWEQLTASDVNFTIVRPIVLKYAKLKNLAVVYACLVVRSYFLGESEVNLAYAGVMTSRAMLCEILAMKLQSHFASNHIELVAVLTTTWSPLAGASNAVIDQVRDAYGGEDGDAPEKSALEMAIATEAKKFLASPVTQKVINDIWSGRVVFSTENRASVLADNYKPRAITIYDHRTAPFLDHYRLRVPRYGAVLEFFNVGVLLFTFCLCILTHNNDHVTFGEILFIVFAASFVLDEYTAATEHGWIIYIANIWNVLDSSFIVIVLLYLGFRIRGLVEGDPDISDTGFDILSTGACILFPRLAFFALKNNLVILSLRVMISQFLFFIGVAAVCFSGLLFTLWTLARGTSESAGIPDPWTLKKISWLMVQIWFGNTYLSFQQASSFHPFFGPILMTIFAAMANTLLLTILISILSNTVAQINEYLYQFAITTLEGLQASALVSYQPPFNLLALVLLKPFSYILSPRRLHSANVFLIKLTTFPILIIIGVYERFLAAGREWRETGRDSPSLFTSLPRQLKNMPILEGLVGTRAEDLVEAIFDVDEEHDDDLFQTSNEEDEERQGRRYYGSREHSRTPTRGLASPPDVIRRLRAERQTSRPRPRTRTLSSASEVVATAEVPSGPLSPLAKFFGYGREGKEADPASVANVQASMKRMEAALDDVKDLPVQKLRDEMKEMQERQARIENLLMTLTRGMRHDSL